MLYYGYMNDTIDANTQSSSNPMSATTQVVSPTPTTATPRTTQPVSPTPTSSVDNINQFQTDYYNKLADLESPLKSDEQIKAEIEADLGGLQVPQAPNLSDLYKTMRNEGGLSQLESTKNELNKMLNDEMANLRLRKARNRNEIVSMDVIGGRESELNRQAQENVDFIGRQLSVVNDSIESQNKYIDTVIQLTGVDADNAFRTYNAEFSQRMETRKQFQQEKELQDDKSFKLIQWQKDSALTQLEMYTELVSKGQLDLSRSTPDQKLAIGKLEIQSGLGLGFLSKIQAPKGDNIKSITQRDDPNGYTYATVLSVNPQTGKIEKQEIKLGRYKATGGGGGSTSSSSTKNSYGYTASQWNTKVSSARSYLIGLEKQSEQNIINNGGTTGTGKADGDKIVGQNEIDWMEEQFKSKFGSAGKALLTEALNTGGYKAWDYEANKAVSVKWKVS